VSDVPPGDGPRRQGPGDGPRRQGPGGHGPPVAGTGAGRSWRRRLRLAALGAGGVLFALVVWAVVWYEEQVHAGPPSGRVVVEVPVGATASSVGAELARRHVVTSSLALRIYDLFHGTPVIGAGGYALRRNESLAAVHDSLSAGPDVLVVPPGFTVSETAARLSELPGHDGAAFATAVAQRRVVSSLEPTGVGNLDGLLGVGDYVVGRHQSAASLLADMVERFDVEAAAAHLDANAAALGVTPYQAVVIASIVQKEGVYPQNLAKVARVIYNRLARGMPLQMDSTVLYSEHRDGGPVTGADLALDTPYNTYLHTGLPPTPICFPSAASLDAALHPAAGSWLYFVLVSPDGTEAFSDTLAQQQANERLAKSRGLP
jgi:UPF0755 protein